MSGYIGSYELTMRDRALTVLPRLLGASSTVGRLDSLTSEQSTFTQTVSELAARHEEEERRREKRQREQERVRARVVRAEKIRNRRDELRAQAGYADAVPAQRAEIEAQVEEWLAQEFPPEREEARA